MARKKDLVYERLFTTIRDLYMYQEEGMIEPHMNIKDLKSVIRKVTFLYEK